MSSTYMMPDSRGKSSGSPSKQPFVQFSAITFGKSGGPFLLVGQLRRRREGGCDVTAVFISVANGIASRGGSLFDINSSHSGQDRLHLHTTTSVSMYRVYKSVVHPHGPCLKVHLRLFVSTCPYNKLASICPSTITLI